MAALDDQAVSAHPACGGGEMWGKRARLRGMLGDEEGRRREEWEEAVYILMLK